MVEDFRIYQFVPAPFNDLEQVDSIPGDQVCTVYIGGNGIVNEQRATRLGAMVEYEVLRDLWPVPNYVVMYDSLTIAENRPERLVAFSKEGNDVLPRHNMSSAIYMTEKNLDNVFRRKVLPFLVNGDSKAVSKIQFVYDGDSEEIISRLLDKIWQFMEQLNFPFPEILSTVGAVVAHSQPYEDFSPEYPYEMFNKILLPRITNENGMRLPIDTALRRARGINFICLCHGAHVMHVMEQKMTDTMRELGYTPNEIRRVMSQVLVVAFAPSCALGQSKFQFIGFTSAYDHIVDMPNNWIYKYIKENCTKEVIMFNEGSPDWKWNMPPMFLGGRNGNTFVVKQRFKYPNETTGPNKISGDEHNDAHFDPEYGATNDGQLLALLAHNVLINGIRNSFDQDNGFKPMPPIEDLVLNDINDDNTRNIFMKMVVNGNEFMGKVYKYIEDTQQIHMLHSQHIKR